jgi:hypothetical protein
MSDPVEVVQESDFSMRSSDNGVYYAIRYSQLQGGSLFGTDTFPGSALISSGLTPGMQGTYIAFNIQLECLFSTYPRVSIACKLCAESGQRLPG